MLYQSIKHIYPAIRDSQFSLQDDGEGAYIKAWEYSEPRPTASQLQAASGEASATIIIKTLEGALDRHLDEVAQEYRYESIRTMVTYAASTHPTFGNEGRAAVAFRDAVYAYGIQCISDVQNGLREIPTEAELIAELPQFTSFLE
jgi:hypothetical protein